MSILEKNKQSRETQFGVGKHKKMVLPDGTAKGMKLVLDVKGLNAEKMRKKLSKFEDFSCQMTLLEGLVRSKGHVCLYLPKYHCELNPIERNWCHAKKTVHKW